MSDLLNSFSITMVGAGNMGGAMLRGWLSKGMEPSRITVVDPSPNPQIANFLSDAGVRIVSVAEGLQKADILLLAVKPQVMAEVLSSVKGLVGPGTLAVSVAAGKTIASIKSGLGDCAVVRVMPNTPALVGAGASVGVACPMVDETRRSQVYSLMAAIGTMDWVEDEQLINAVTALSGSGPAYGFHLAEAMAEAGASLGLPADLAQRLAVATVAGAGRLMTESSDDPATLRQNVTSPNGTTQAALEVLMNGETGLPPLMKKAMQAAKQRSEDLSK